MSTVQYQSEYVQYNPPSLHWEIITARDLLTFSRARGLFGMEPGAMGGGAIKLISDSSTSPSLTFVTRPVYHLES